MRFFRCNMGGEGCRGSGASRFWRSGQTQRFSGKREDISNTSAGRRAPLALHSSRWCARARGAHLSYHLLHPSPAQSHPSTRTRHPIHEGREGCQAPASGALATQHSSVDRPSAKRISAVTSLARPTGVRRCAVCRPESRSRAREKMARDKHDRPFPPPADVQCLPPSRRPCTPPRP